MSEYTELLNYEAETLSSVDDEYEKKLMQVAELFRGFDEAFTDFITEYGYSGDVTDVSAKARFVTERFKVARIKPPRNIDKWFVPVKKLERKTVFQLCFAFGLDVEKTNDFFRRVRFERSFDCHTVSEAVYYFCMRNRLSYPDAQEIIDSIRIPESVKTIPERDVLYTGTIIDYINSIDDTKKLIRYIEDNADDFRYNNATAVSFIQELWKIIAADDGLAVREGALIDRINQSENVSDDYVVVGKGDGTWTIFSQIIGLSVSQKDAYKSGRSLTSVLSDNKLMPLRADYCFPNRQNIEKLVRGELVADHEIIRKILILLVFYKYWAALGIGSDVAFYRAKITDCKKCLDNINNYLLDSGYLELYEGNPYDWIFMWALNDDYPLSAFRAYMGEVFSFKEEQAETVH